jgi:hypothetical protein
MLISVAVRFAVSRCKLCYFAVVVLVVGLILKEFSAVYVAGRFRSQALTQREKMRHDLEANYNRRLKLITCREVSVQCVDLTAAAVGFAVPWVPPDSFVLKELKVESLGIVYDREARTKILQRGKLGTGLYVYQWLEGEDTVIHIGALGPPGEGVYGSELGPKEVLLTTTISSYPVRVVASFPHGTMKYYSTILVNWSRSSVKYQATIIRRVPDYLKGERPTQEELNLYLRLVEAVRY